MLRLYLRPPDNVHLIWMPFIWRRLDSLFGVSPSKVLPGLKDRAWVRRLFPFPLFYWLFVGVVVEELGFVVWRDRVVLLVTGIRGHVTDRPQYCNLGKYNKNVWTQGRLSAMRGSTISTRRNMTQASLVRDKSQRRDTSAIGRCGCSDARATVPRAYRLGNSGSTYSLNKVRKLL